MWSGKGARVGASLCVGTVFMMVIDRGCGVGVGVFFLRETLTPGIGL